MNFTGRPARLARLSCTFGTPGFIASRGSLKTGSGAYSTSIGAAYTSGLSSLPLCLRHGHNGIAGPTNAFRLNEANLSRPRKGLQ
jgi:hypothetical protein